MFLQGKLQNQHSALSAKAEFFAHSPFAWRQDERTLIDRNSDSIAALHGVIGALMALHHRQVNGGKGQVVDVALYEAVFNMMESVVPEYGVYGMVRERTGASLPGIVPSNTYPCRDGSIWDKVVRDGYAGVEGDVDADVVINL